MQEAAFDPGLEFKRLAESDCAVGASVSFTGIVRSPANDPIKKLLIEHYPTMTKSAIETMVAEAHRRWRIIRCHVIHRYGDLYPGEAIVMVVVHASHRMEAFEAAMFLMDYLKSRAPFWKKEYRDTRSDWVESREEDETAVERWAAANGEI